MSVFNLGISCLTTYNLPWFMDLTTRFLWSTFLYSTRYYYTIRHIHSLALFSPWPSCFILTGDISTCPPLFPSSVLDIYQPWVFVFCCHIFLLFLTVHAVIQARALKKTRTMGSHFFPSCPRSVRTLYYDPSILGFPACLGS